MIYLGTLGRMVGIKCPASQNVEAEDRYSFNTTLEGRVKAQARPVLGGRSWSLQTSDATTPEDAATIMGFANGEWGAGPFVFISADAPVTNLLTPDEASCLYQSPNANIRRGGPVNLGADGWAGQSIQHLDPAGGSEIYFSTGQTPVLAGQPVTGSAWIRGDGARVRLYWYTEGSVTPMAGTVSSATITAGDGWKRATVTGTPPAGAVGVAVVAQYAFQAARPAITWTSEMFPLAAGEGCPKAVLHGASKSLVLAGRGRGQQYANLSYTITEVG